MSNIFEKAAQVKLRFTFSKNGHLYSPEDLFLLPLTSATGRANLNDLAKSVAKVLRESSEDSFVEVSKSTTEDNLRLDILKRVIEVRQADNAAKVDAKAANERKNYIATLISKKQHEELDGMSLEELKKL